MPTKKYATDQASLKQECVISFLRASGPGGQNRNKVETGVRVYHRPSKITVTATDGRTQAENRRRAFERMQRRLQRLNSSPKHRVPTRVPRGQKRQRLESKRIQSIHKQQRKPPLLDES